MPLLQTSVEEMIASTAYLDLFLRSVSETALLKTFLRFVLLHRHDNMTILDTLVGRINSNSRVSPVAPHSPPTSHHYPQRLHTHLYPIPNVAILVPSHSHLLLLSCHGLGGTVPRLLCCPSDALHCPQLCMVSLSLFRTLLSLNCEDVMLQLVLR